MIACFLIPQIGIIVERSTRPDLAGQPLALVDDGVVQVASTEASTAGVRAGMPMAGARSLCHELATLPYKHEAYEKAAHSIWDLLAEESSFVEPVTPEMAYAVLTPSIARLQARELLARIVRECGVPASIGIGRSKLIARQAATAAKQNSILLIPTEHEIEFLKKLPIANFPVDPKFAQKLQRLGITTLRDLANVDGSQAGAPSQGVDTQLIPRQLKEGVYRLQQLARGNDGDPVRPLWPQGSYSVRQIFDHDNVDLAALHLALEHLSQQLAQMLSRNAKYCRTYVLKIEYCNSLSVDLAEKLARPMADAPALFRASLRLLDRLLSNPSDGIGEGLRPPSPQSWGNQTGFAESNGRVDWHEPRETRDIRVIHLTAADLAAGGGIQRTLLDEWGHTHLEERKRSLITAIDLVRERWKPTAVVSAGDLNQGRQASFAADALGHRRNETVDVHVDDADKPRQFASRSNTYRVVDIQDRWHERLWFWGSSTNQWVYRVQTTPAALAELSRSDTHWRLTALMD